MFFLQNYKILLTASVILGFTASPSLAITINFDNLSGGMTYLPGNSVPSQAYVSNQFLSTSGVLFGSSDFSVALVNLGFGHATSGSNGIGGVTNGVLSYSAPIIASFFLPTNPSIKAVTDFVSVKPDSWPDRTKSILLEAFGVNGNLLGSVTAVDPSPLSISVTGIHSVRITGNGTSAFDDFTFNNVTSAKAESVPEPTSALGLLALGALGTGSLLKRKQQQQVQGSSLN